MKPAIDYRSLRAKKARLGHKTGKNLTDILFVLSPLLLGGGLIVVLYLKHSWGYFLMALSLICYMFASWVKYDLQKLAPEGEEVEKRLSADILALVKKNSNSPQAVWSDISGHWQAIFFTNHLLFPGKAIEPLMSDSSEELNTALAKAAQLADENDSRNIELGFLAAGLLLTNERISSWLKGMKQGSEDIEELAD